MARVPRYTKDELLNLLRKQCPDALAKIPPPEVFQFDTSERIARLRVGKTIKRVRRAEVDLWVECVGFCKPFLTFKARTTPNGRAKQITDDHFAGYFFFGKLRDDGTLNTFSNTLKALVAFIFVYCGHRNEFADFDYGDGLPYLVRGLRKIATRVPNGEQVKNDNDLESNEIKNTIDPTVEDGNDHGAVISSSEVTVKARAAKVKKRTLKVEDDDSEAVKRIRTV